MLLAATAFLAALAFLTLVTAIRLWTVTVPVRARIIRGAFNQLVFSRLGPPERLVHELPRTDQPFPLGPSTPEKPPTGAAAKRFDVTPWVATTVDAAIPAVDMLLRWHSVDAHVFQAASHLAHQQVDGFSDLLRLVDAKEYAISTEGFYRKLLGHVGEWHAHEHLADAGLAPAMHVTSNFPGSDMLVNGHELNVKLVTDAGHAASEHFAQYPDIGVLVPHDAMNIPVDALHFDPTHGLDPSMLGHDHVVLVDHALSHADVAHQTHHALDVLKDPGPHLHFPWVTMAVSGVREARLLIKGHTDLVRAAKNVAVDTAVVGSGGLVGMKTGAAIGMVAGPIGSIVGGIVGGVGGGLLGRHYANKVKRAPLLEAKGAYDSTLSRYEQEEHDVTVRAQGAWDQAQTWERAAFGSAIARSKEAYDHAVLRSKARVSAACTIAAAEAEGLLDSAERKLTHVAETSMAALRRAVPNGFARLFLSVWSAPLAAAQAYWLSRDLRAWRRERRRVIRAYAHADARKLTSAVMDLILAAPEGGRAAQAFIEHMEKARVQSVAEAGRAAGQLLASVADQRRTTVSRLRQHHERIESEVAKALAPAIAALKNAGDELTFEMRKAGMAV